MSAHVLLNLLNELRKTDKMRGCSRIFSLFRYDFNTINNTGARMLDSIYHMTFKIILKSYFGVTMLEFCQCLKLKASFRNISPKICKLIFYAWCYFTLSCDVIL